MKYRLSFSAKHPEVEWWKDGKFRLVPWKAREDPAVNEEYWSTIATINPHNDGFEFLYDTETKKITLPRGFTKENTVFAWT